MPIAKNHKLELTLDDKVFEMLRAIVQLQKGPVSNV
jgi:hypothetical protein